MAINQVHVDTGINAAPTLHNQAQEEREARLRALLGLGGTLAAEGMKNSATKEKTVADNAAALDRLIKGDSLKGDRQKHNLDILPEVAKKYPGQAIDFDADGGFKLGAKRDTTVADEMRSARFEETKKKNLEANVKSISDTYGKGAEYHSLLKELDNMTNKDGKGGILSNPDAHLQSSGKITNALPSTLLGVASLAPGYTGVTPEQVAERKVVDRVRNEYMKQMSGMRVTEGAAKREKEGLGMLASGDPALLEKGIRSLALAHQERLKASVGARDPEALARVHESLGYDPTSDLKIYQEPPKFQKPDLSSIGIGQAPPTRDPAAAGPSDVSPAAPAQPGIMTPEQWKADKAAKAAKSKVVGQ